MDRKSFEIMAEVEGSWESIREEYIGDIAFGPLFT